MKTHMIFLFLVVSLSLMACPLQAGERYSFTHSDARKVKAILNDPSPFYEETDYLRKWLPPAVWDQVTFDVAEMKRAWSTVVGFKAPEVVGKIAPEITPGTYSCEDKEKYPFDELMPPYFYNKFNPPGQGPYPNHIGNFTEIKVIPTRQYYWPLPVAEATRRHLGEAKQDDQGYIIERSYTAGYPFPRPSGQHKAMQIMYNWMWNYLNWENIEWLDHGIGVGRNFRQDFEATGIFHRVKTWGRTVFPPFGFFDKRAEKQGETAIAIYQALSPRDVYGNVYFAVKYADAHKPDNSLAYINILRRARKMSGSDRQDQAIGRDMTFDDTGGFDQKVSPEFYPYEYRVLEEREFLVPLTTLDGSVWIDSENNFEHKNLEFERRPVWVIEMKQKDPNYIYSKRIWYVDRETLLPMAIMNYDQKGRLYRTYAAIRGFIPPMGSFAFFNAVYSDHIDVHSTFILTVIYPAPWVSRKDVCVKSMMKAK